MSTNTNTNSKQKKDRSYNEIKEHTIKKIVTHARELRDDIIEMIKALRAEKKDRAAVTQQLKNDFVIPKYLSKSFVLGIIREDYDALSPLEKTEKKKIAIAAGTGQQMSEDGNDSDSSSDSDDDDIITKREKAKQEMLTKSIKKGSAQMPRLKPTVNSTELENDDEDDEEDEQNTFADEDDTIPENVLQDVNNIVVDDLQHLAEIRDLIVSGHAVVIQADRNLVTIGVSKGKKLEA